jgi:hypothetical protein
MVLPPQRRWDDHHGKTSEDESLVKDRFGRAVSKESVNSDWKLTSKSDVS